MNIILLSMLPFLAALAFVFILSLRHVKCRACGDALPPICSPFKKTRRMWRVGGYLCARCGCETDMAGQAVTAETPTGRFPLVPVTVVAIALVAGAGLGVAGLVLSAHPEKSPIAVRPAAGELPQQAPVIVPR